MRTILTALGITFAFSYLAEIFSSKIRVLEVNFGVKSFSLKNLSVIANIQIVIQNDLYAFELQSVRGSVYQYNEKVADVYKQSSALIGTGKQAINLTTEIKIEGAARVLEQMISEKQLSSFYFKGDIVAQGITIPVNQRIYIF